MNRRIACAALWLVCVFLGGTGMPGDGEDTSSRHTVLVIRMSGASFEETVAGIRSELNHPFFMSEMVIGTQTGVDDVREAIERFRPSIIVCMDNRAVSLLASYQAGVADSLPIIPSVSVMASFVGSSLQRLRNARAISYEVPIVTSVVNLRAILTDTIRTIGIVHRPFLEEFIEKNSAWCEREGIRFVRQVVETGKKGNRRSIRRALRELMEDSIDVLWVPNDNALLTPETIRDIWVPMIHKHSVPAIVGVQVLVDPRIGMGTFAVLPDHGALGAQVAECILDAQRNGWVFAEKEIEPPLSVYKTINLKQAEAFSTIHPGALAHVDKVVR